MLRTWIAIIFALMMSTPAVSDVISDPSEVTGSESQANATEVALVGYVLRDYPPQIWDNNVATISPLFSSYSTEKSTKTLNSLSKSNPGNEIAIYLAELIASRTGGRVDQDPQRLASLKMKPDPRSGLKYIVDTEMTIVVINYFALDWAHYSVEVVGHIRIRDGETGKVIQRLVCSGNPHTKEGAPTAEELAENDGKRYFELLAASTEACKHDLDSKPLKI